MPIYEYAAVTRGCACCEAHFDVLQKLSEAALTKCPECGAAVQRVISAPNVAIGHAGLLKESHAEKHGFTQYRRAGKGVYEKAYGKGPKFISDK
ncbi:MAG: zinc ribbon domain-containing protein [Proteobacteria bacterium]|nr:zinc ribbon domain-containing protein [Pseudomonadota bacterium]